MRFRYVLSDSGSTYHPACLADSGELLDLIEAMKPASITSQHGHTGEMKKKEID